VLSGCFSGDYSSEPVAAPTSTTAAEVTVRGEVGAFSASARVMALAQPVNGFTSVVVSVDTEVVRSNGATAAVTDLGPRAGVEVSGRPGLPGTLVARRIVIL
jgi:hypothetical protein